jgi:S-adenosylmethionine:tRNA ribosyltransferase-isomerase
MQLSEFDYYLPKCHIAQYPAAERASSRLLVLDRKREKIQHRVFKDLIRYLHAGDVLVVNDSRVLPVRLYGKKTSGGKVEVLLLKEIQGNIWQAVVKGVQSGKVMFKKGISGRVTRNNGYTTILFNSAIRDTLSEIGITPLPPYIKRPAEKLDEERYQTVYAEKDGSIAAPTAGLHFTGKLLRDIEKNGIHIEKLTLHVGYGTFKPVSSSPLELHQMDKEYYEISERTAEVINYAKSHGRKIIAVGTTVTRALETSAMSIPGNTVKSDCKNSEIFIFPGFKFRVIDALITNFHLPKSTPFMLTSAFTGLPLLKKAYFAALGRNYCFYSYGDAMFIA